MFIVYHKIVKDGLYHIPFKEMFYTDKQVVDKINNLYRFANHPWKENDLTLPKLEDLIELLNNRQTINFFYLSQELGVPNIDPTGDSIPTINMTLTQVFIHPWGDLIWSDDESLKFIEVDNYNMIKDSINNLINQRITAHKCDNLDEFVKKLNRGKS